MLFRVHQVVKTWLQSEKKILSPTDCVKDRLAGYMYFKSRDNFDQALLVAKKHPVDLIKIKSWCGGEKHLEVFDEFLGALKGRNQKK